MKKLLPFYIMLLCFNANAMTVPTLSSPANNSTLIVFGTSLSCLRVTGATDYQFQFDTVNTFNSGFLTTSTVKPTGNSSTVSQPSPLLRLGKSYFWRVRAYKTADTSAWSSPSKFSTSNGQQPLTIPSNNSIGPITRLTTFIMGTDSSIRYMFEADTNTTFSSPLRVLRTITSNQFEDSILFDFNRTIFWRATSTNGIGDTLLWSSIRRYTTHALPLASGSDTQIAIVDPGARISWSNPGLSSVQVQFDTVNNFTSPAMQLRWVNAFVAADTIRDLDFGRIYYYRIRANYRGKFSPWSNLRTIQVKTNGRITTPSINGATIGPIKNVGFWWDRLDGTRTMLKLYADSGLTQLLKDTITSAFSYRYQDVLKFNKWYQLHITYFHDKDTAITLVRHFRMLDGSFSLRIPEDGAENQIVRPRLVFYLQPFFSQYVMEVDTGIAFPQKPSTYFQRYTSFDTSFGSSIEVYKTISPLLYNQKYVWRVYGILGTDTGAAKSNVFTTAAKPINYSPSDGAFGIGTSSNGLVTTIDSSAFIQWEIDTSANFTSSVRESGIDRSVRDSFQRQFAPISLSKNMLFHAKYYWRARCINEVDTSEWSDPFTFVTTTDVNLRSPSDRSSNIPTKVRLNWYIDGAYRLHNGYQYQIGTDPTFASTPIVTLAIGALPEDTFAGGDFSTIYYWRVRAFNKKDTSRWSVRYSYTTKGIPIVSNTFIRTPEENTTVTSSPIRISWMNASYATSYDLQISTDSGFINKVASPVTTSTWFDWQNAQILTQYYCRVRGKNEFDTAAWSGTRKFKTAQTLSIIEADEFKELAIYPVPTNGKLFIELPTQFTSKIVDISGKFMWESKSPDSFVEVNLENWNNGIYIIEVETLKGRTYRKIIVQQ